MQTYHLSPEALDLYVYYVDRDMRSSFLTSRGVDTSRMDDDEMRDAYLNEVVSQIQDIAFKHDVDVDVSEGPNDVDLDLFITDIMNHRYGTIG